MIKSGRTAQGAKAASSHTGSLMGSDEVYDAVFAQSGVMRMDSAQEMFDRIRAEYDRAVEAVLYATNHANLMDSDPIIQRSIQLRNPYVDPLNYIQIDMLRRLRALPDQTSSEAEALREVIVMTINGIASGLRNTG